LLHDLWSGAVESTRSVRNRLLGDVHTRLAVYAVAAGVVVRLAWILGQDFPLNDGALFSTMVRDLQANHYAVPWYTSYNATQIPFSYPFLPFYLAGFVADLTPWSLLDVFRVVPPLIACLTLPAFYGLARELLASKQAAVFALFAYALLPQTFQWLIMGGGITRSLGVLFGLLALRQAYLLYARGQPRRVLWTALFAGLTLLSHPEVSLFLAFSVCLLFLFYGRSRQAVLHSVAVAAGALLIASPWLITILARHGAAILWALGDDGWPWFSGVLSLALLQITREPFFPLIASVGLLGMLKCLADRRYFLPVWFTSVFLYNSRSPTQRAVIPLALMVGIGVTEVLIPLLNRHEKASRRSPVRLVMVAFVLLFTILGALALPGTMMALPRDEREAMRWVADNTPESSRVLVIPYILWPVDRSCEWLPVLAQRPCVSLVQGYEWLPGFSDRVAQHDALLECVASAEGCLGQWAGEYGVQFSHVFVPKWPLSQTGAVPQSFTSPAAMLKSLDADPSYRLVYNGLGAAVYSTSSE
jgi:hypothetical protein